MTVTTSARRTGQAGLFGLLFIANTAMFAVYFGVGGPLVQSAIEVADPVNKVSNAGLVAGVSAIFATLFNPIGGALSDRTHSRFGRRNPWLLGGALAAFVALWFLGTAKTVIVILVAWSIAQAMMNLFQAALTAVVPDRVPRELRGTASAVAGIATSVAAIIGTQIAAAYIGSVAGYLLLGGGVVASAVLLVLFSRDPRPGEYEVVVKERRSPFAALTDFLSALKHRDFMWVFLGRALMNLSYFMVLMFQLYILQDYIALPSGVTAIGGVATLTLINTGTSVVATLIGGPLADKLQRYRLFVFASSAITGLALLILLLSPTWTGMMIFAAVNGVSFGAYYAVDTALVTLVLPNPENAARDLGVLNIANAGPQMIAPLAAAFLIGLGGYPTLFIAGIVVAILGSLTVLRVKSVR
ncbi:MFS transporter [Microtetraspora sp. NBRC 16547]|uniref:MFS transporter n=1 Tax=Microtetraspora sp. NBRC 16547 TaxID=3030993 RepID=UPI0024A4737E|nr:MFS transporter [Microtetraspora sp. NBRC 16547]GLW96758.1 MFS transporter [Microtetraspora sp. NBRC 16547]